MGIKTGSYNVDAAVAAGFVKNDGAGNFSFGESGGGGGGDLTLLSTVDVTVATTSVSFTGLNGDVDKLYKLVYKIVQLAGPPNLTKYTVRPNGVTTGQFQTIAFHASGGSTAVRTNPFFQIASGPGLSLPIDVFGEMIIDAESNTGALLRYFNSSEGRFVTGFATPLTLSIRTGTWNDVTTNITSLDIVATDALAMAPGSHFSLYRVTK